MDRRLRGRPARRHREGFAAFDGDGAFVAAGAELGSMVAPSARGGGVATAMLRKLTDWAFAEGIQRCELFISAGNVPSERVAERVGYAREGLLRSVHLKGDQRNDVTVWSRLPSDPAP